MEKTTINYVLILASILTIFIGCEDYEPTTTHLSCIVDVSDKTSYKPRAKDITSYISKGHDSDGLEMTLRYVSETRYAPSYTFTLGKGEVGFLSNEDTRRRKRKRILQQFQDTLQVANHRKEPKRSEIYRLLVSELNRLSKVEGHKTIVLFSDLEEHSFFSVYRRSDVQQLLKKSKQTGKRFTKAAKLADDLQGITLHIIYTPSLHEDKVFTAMIQLYRNLLESRGAKLSITQSRTVAL